MVGEDWLPTFSWSVFDEESGADDYRVLVADNPSFVDPHIDAVVTTESYEHDAELAANRVYYWKVVARNEQGEADPFPIPTFSFYTGTSVPETLYVDDDAAPGGSGADWDDALNSPHNALTAAGLDGADVSEIRVARGTYKPGDGPEDREISFELVSGTHLLGGLAGIGAEDPDARDIEAFVTILSGDLLDNDEDGFVNIEDNSRHVVRGSLTDETTLLDGFTIMAGNAEVEWVEGLHADGGGGMKVWFGSPRVTRCKFLRNWAGGDGGGIIANVSEMSISDSLFDGNFAQIDGGGVRIWGSDAGRVTNCTFTNNRAGYGGGLGVERSAPWIVNCLFAGNSSTDDVYNGTFGGGFFDWDEASSTLVNCTFVDNQADALGGAIGVERDCATTLINCILWNNSAPVGPQAWVGGSPSTLTISYSDVMDGEDGVGVEAGSTLFWGAGNIDADPLFVDPDGPDDVPETYEDNNYRLAAESMVIDAGDNLGVPEWIEFDLDGNPRFVDDPETEDSGRCELLCERGIVDMGPYEFQGGGCVREPEWVCDGDVDGDGQVNPVDSGLVQAAFGSTDEQDLCNYDVDCDGQINPVDSGIVQSLFGTCDPPRDACP